MGGCSSCQKVPSCQELSILVRRGLLDRHVHFELVGPDDAPELINHMQALVDTTMELSPSRKTRQVPQKLIVKKVLQSSNMLIYARYAAKRQQIREARRGDVQPVVVQTSDLAQKMQEFRAARNSGRETTRLLDPDINEVYLWHGTSYESVRNIFSEDFRVGHEAKMGLFGKGLYFAESCAKADEYSCAGRHEQGWYSRQTHAIEEGSLICAMLLCRIVLGKVKVMHHCGNFLGSKAMAEQEFDALVGDREMHRREFVLSSADAVFPEFGVFYQRHYERGGAAESEAIRGGCSQPSLHRNAGLNCEGLLAPEDD
eukprot:gnl/TRDRNA2_/TRDRNA2_44385_c0_seq1.p1 gnl/TRDRNA2_/TRDRNA2_44385_c0~~gnl/TRDRNA2_/TRDRNA2_44385_c0_seq1.p1  ORF type:complete len:314 (-),score=34.37 gnl/TRDRNA2_/TRDRNA2_44385_c0_seq1:412-1353(-)